MDGDNVFYLLLVGLYKLVEMSTNSKLKLKHWFKLFGLTLLMYSVHKWHFNQQILHCITTLWRVLTQTNLSIHIMQMKYRLYIPGSSTSPAMSTLMRLEAVASWYNMPYGMIRKCSKSCDRRTCRDERTNGYICASVI